MVHLKTATCSISSSSKACEKNAEEAEILVNVKQKQVIRAFAAVLIVVKNEDRFYVSASVTLDL